MSEDFAALDQMAESFLARLRSGEAISPEDYAARHPEWAERIRQLFTTLAAMERLTHVLVKPPEQGGRRIGEFRILREVGHGGMGVVYEAVQEPLGRHVALKVLVRRDGTLLERFQREARLAARLHHTNIVPVFGIGTEGDVPYYAMQFIDGHTLKALLDAKRQQRSEGSTLPETPAKDDAWPREAARLTLQAAEALAYAHKEGVLHRDLKPSNLLLDGKGTLWVADFGLATAEGEAELTKTGDLLGTYRYLAPERLAGRCDARSDIYALGATLYELLTLEPVYAENDPARLLERIAHDDPMAPRQRDAGVPADLEIITLKALRRDPATRYSSAADLADDLRNYLSDRPISARRQTLGEQVRRLIRRYPGRAAALATTMAALLLGAMAAATSLVWMRGERDAARAAEQVAKDERERANEQLFVSHLNASRASRSSGQVGQRLLGLRAIQSVLGTLQDEELTPQKKSELRDEAIACLALPDLREVRRFPAPYLRHHQETAADPSLSFMAHETEDHTASVLTYLGDQARSVRLGDLPALRFVVRTLHPEGSLLAEGLISASVENSRLRVWDCTTRTKLFETAVPLVNRSFAFHPDGRHLVLASTDGTLRLYDVRAGKEIRRSPPHYRPWSLAVSPDGQRIAVGSNYGSVEIVDFATWKIQATIPSDTPVVDPVWSPDGLWLAFGGMNGRVTVWGGQRPKVRILAEPQSCGTISLAFSPEGHLLASSSRDGVTKVWSWPSGRQLYGVPGQLVRFGGPQKGLLIQDAGLLKHYHLESHEELRILDWPADSAVFSPDGQWLATAGLRGVSLWCASTLTIRADFGLDHCEVVAFHPHDGSLATVGTFSQLRLWPCTRNLEGCQFGPPRVVPLPTPQHLGHQVTWSRNGETLATVDTRSGTVLILPQGTASSLRKLATIPGLYRVILSPDGTLVLGITMDSKGATVFRVADGTRVYEIPGQFALSPDGIIALTMSPDGQTMIVGSGGIYQMIRTDTWSVTRTLTSDVKDAGVFAEFSPNGRLFVLAMSPRHLRLYDATTAKPLATLTLPEAAVISHLDFSPDSTQLAITHRAAKIYLWNLRNLNRQLSSLGLDWGGVPDPPGPPTPPGPAIVVKSGNPPLYPLKWSEEWSFLALIEAKQKRGPDTIHALTNALHTLPEDAALVRANLLSWRGQEFQNVGFLQAARADWLEAIQLAPEATEADARLAWLYVIGPESMRDPQRALPLALAAAQRKPDQADTSALLGAVYVRRNRYEEACPLLERSIPSLSGARQAAASLFLALARTKRGEKSLAEAAWREGCLGVERCRADSVEKEGLLRLQVEVEVERNRVP